MANADAFSEGFDAGVDKSRKKKTPKPVSKVFTSDGQTLTPTAQPKSFKKGGTVRKTGYAKVHRHEVVLTPAQAKKLSKRHGGKSTVKKFSKR